jgi:hypothetical protein
MAENVMFVYADICLQALANRINKKFDILALCDHHRLLKLLTNGWLTMQILIHFSYLPSSIGYLHLIMTTGWA